MLNPPEKTPELFERYLPYALALDCENEWNAKFTAVLAAAALAGATAPVWYSGSNWNSGSMGGFTESLGSSLASSAASASQAPGSAQVPAAASPAAAVHRAAAAVAAAAAAGKPSLLPALPSAFQVPATVPRPGSFPPWLSGGASWPFQRPWDRARKAPGRQASFQAWRSRRAAKPSWPAAFQAHACP